MNDDITFHRLVPRARAALRLGVPVLIAAGLGACATTPKQNDQVEAARAEIDRVSADPLAQSAAATDLDQARASLRRADDALHAGRPVPEVDQLGYLALREAQTGAARVDEAHSRQSVADASRQREQVLLQAREREVQTARSQAEQAREQAQAAQQQAQSTQQQLALAQQQTQSTQQQLTQAQQELEQLRTKQTDRGRVMTLSSDTLFDTGQASLKAGAQHDLERLARYLKDSPNTRVIVEGFTDGRGGDDYNQRLSERRAEAVAAALRDNGVSGDRIETRGMGKGYPVASNDTPSGRQQNRRVEVVLSDQGGRFAEGANSDAAQRR